MPCEKDISPYKACQKLLTEFGKENIDFKFEIVVKQCFKKIVFPENMTIREFTVDDKEKVEKYINRNTQEQSPVNYLIEKTKKVI